MTPEQIDALVALSAHCSAAMARNVATGGWSRSTATSVTAEQIEALNAFVAEHRPAQHVEFVPPAYERLWAGARSTVTHLFVRGPGAGDRSLCGRVGFHGPMYDVLEYDPECIACNRIAEREVVPT